VLLFLLMDFTESSWKGGINYYFSVGDLASDRSGFRACCLRDDRSGRQLSLDWQYDEALDCNIALTGGLDLSHGAEFTDRIEDTIANLYERSVNLLLAHEDKTYSGAMIASATLAPCVHRGSMPGPPGARHGKL
jgi:hypothetical protein